MGSLQKRVETEALENKKIGIDEQVAEEVFGFPKNNELGRKHVKEQLQLSLDFGADHGRLLKDLVTPTLVTPIFFMFSFESPTWHLLMKLETSKNKLMLLSFSMTNISKNTLKSSE